MLATEQEAEVKQAAEQLLTQEPDWVTFYREILGPQGVVRHTFPTRDTLAAFERSGTYQEILQMLNRLREHGPVSPRGRSRRGSSRSGCPEAFTRRCGSRPTSTAPA